MLMDSIRKTVAKDKIGEESLYTPTYNTGFDIIDYRNGRIESGEPVIGFDGGRIVTIIGKSGSGKAQPLYSKVLTPNGFRNMGDLKIGDEVSTPDGSKAKIIGIFPRGIKDNYKVTFSDGSSMECNDEHLFTVEYLCWNKHKKETYKCKKVMELKDIMKDYKKGEKLKYYIPITKPINFENNKELPINPYLLGVLIGDGCITESSNKISISNSEKDIFEKIKFILKEDYNSEINYRANSKVSIDFNNQKELKNKLIDLNLYNCYSHEKFIPDIYKYASIEDRIELLKGLIDTDGSIEKSHCIYYYSTSEKLIKDIDFIVKSLGGITNIMKKNTIYSNKNGEKIKTKDTFRIFIKLPQNIIPFSSEKHFKKYIKNTKYKEPVRKISNIEKIGETAMQCILIDSNDHLYITDDFIVTHNSTIARQIAINIANQYEESQIIDLDFEKGINLSRIQTLSKWNNETIEKKYLLLNRDITSESLYKLVKSVAELKTNSDNFDKLKIDTGKKDIKGNKIYILPPTIIIVDSWALMTPKDIADETELSGSMSASAIAKTNNAIIKRIVGSLESANIMLFIINHITQKIEIGFTKTQAAVNYLKQD